LSDLDGAAYGSDSGGCVTYGDIAFIGNSWLQPPMKSEMELNNIAYALLTGGKLIPYSPEGFFDVCPYSSNGVSYPTNLSYSGNTIPPAAP
jgi:hypothetical protein